MGYTQDIDDVMAKINRKIKAKQKIRKTTSLIMKRVRQTMG